MAKLIAFQNKFTSGQSRYTIEDSLFTQDNLDMLTGEYMKHGQLSRIPGVEVAFSREDRTRKPDLTINVVYGKAGMK